MKKLFILMVMALLTVSANAQITTGENTSNVIRTGNRAKEGNFGIYFGATTDMFKNIGDGNIKFSGLPLINVKYMKSDNFEYRLGIEWWKKSTSKTTPVTTLDENMNKISKDVDTNESESSFMFYPGVAYHFNNKNLLDVYVGGEMPFGLAGASYDDGDTNEGATNLRWGLGAFIGLQAYIANLPVAIGVEYGISTQISTVSNATLTQDGMTINKNASPSTNGVMKDYSNTRWLLGHQIRFTLSYYFNL